MNCKKYGRYRTRGCYPLKRKHPVPFTRPDLIGSPVAYYCPASVSTVVAQAGWFSSYNRMKDGHLPLPGSWREQQLRWTQGIDVLDAEIRNQEMIEQENAEKKMEAAKVNG